MTPHLKLGHARCLTPDPLDDASDYTISKPADQSSRSTRKTLKSILDNGPGLKITGRWSTYYNAKSH